MKMLVVIPSKNLETTIGRVIEKIRSLGLDLDILVVNDGSTDSTRDVAMNAGATVLDHIRNLGKGAALKTGFSYAMEHDYDAVITMDGDEQHDPKEIPRFIEALTSGGYDIVVGSRMHAVEDMPGIRIWTNRTTSRIVSRLARQEVPDSQCGFRIIRTALLRAVRLVTSKYDSESELLIRAGKRGFKIASMKIKSIYSGGVSHIRPAVDTLRFIWLVCRGVFWK